MPIQGIHPRKLFVASLTRERAVIRMQLFMTLAVMLPRESLATPRPMTLEWFFLVVGSYMS